MSISLPIGPLSLLCASALLSPTALSQKPPSASKTPATKAQKTAPKPSPFAVLTKGKKRAPVSADQKGLFTLYYDDDRLVLALPASAFAQKFLMIGTLSSGLGQGMLISGAPIGTAVIRFERRGKKVFVHEEGTRFTAKPGSPTARALHMGYPKTILAVLPIRATGPGGEALVDVGSWLLSDPWYLSRVVSADLSGRFAHDRSRSRIEYVKAFERNVELRYMAAYTGLSQKPPETIVDSRYTTISVHTSFHLLPNAGYRKRAADDRVGYFMTVHRNFSKQTQRSTYERYIQRWQLEKADPAAKLSPPKKPIIFYLEKTIPYVWRPYVRRGILAWNKAFRAAGFIDAIEVRQQGDAETWDPEDAKYNSIRWITSNRPSFNAMGPSRVDPYTGQILDADILVEASMVREYWNEFQHSIPAYPGIAPAPKKRGRETLSSLIGRGHEGHACRFSMGKRDDLRIASLLQASLGSLSQKSGRGVPTEFLGLAVQETVMHEVGHTLGLRHNFKGSRFRKGKELGNKELTSKEGLLGSVMDYNSIQIAAEGEKQGEYFASCVGPYDIWAIRYGYTEFGAPKEGKALAKIAAESAEPGHDYGTDEDALAYEAPGNAIDPYCNQWDMGGDVYAFAKSRRDMAKRILPKIDARVVAKGEGYQLERYGVATLVWQAIHSCDHVARIIGGVVLHRDHKGDPGARTPLEVVPAKEQRKALSYVLEHAFGDALLRSIPPEQLARLSPSRWRHWGLGEQRRLDFSLIGLAETAQVGILRRLLTPKVLARILENSLRSRDGGQSFTLPELYEKLTSGILQEALAGKNASVFRRNLQRAFLDLLIAHATKKVPGLPRDARSAALAQVHRLARDLGESKAMDAYNRDHLRELSRRVNQALNASQIIDNDR